jgi:four helix bundle protein
MAKGAKTFRDLLVWRKAHEFVLEVYRLSVEFPKAEVYGLTSQIRRAAVSVAANIAEGFKRRGKAEKGRFLNIAHASLEECRYYLILAKDLSYGDSSKAEAIGGEVSRLLESYSSAILNSEF